MMNEVNKTEGSPEWQEGEDLEAGLTGPDAVIRRVDSLEMRQIGGESFLVATKDFGFLTNSVLLPNRTATFLWTIFRTPHLVSKALAEAKEYFYGKNAITIRDDVEAFVEEGVMLGILEETNPDAACDSGCGRDQDVNPVEEMGMDPSKREEWSHPKVKVENFSPDDSVSACYKVYCETPNNNRGYKYLYEDTNADGVLNEGDKLVFNAPAARYKYFQGCGHYHRGVVRDTPPSVNGFVSNSLFTGSGAVTGALRVFYWEEDMGSALPYHVMDPNGHGYEDITSVEHPNAS